jgi:predicted regulator of Ras-like GTPase activity (Roadblock/LC7/MglB family)
VAQGDTDLVLSENRQGLVLLAPLAKGLVLVVMTDRSAMLGAVRFELKETIPQVNQLFDQKD